MKKTPIVIIVITLIACGIYFFGKSFGMWGSVDIEQEIRTEVTLDTPDEELYEVIGKSVEGRDIQAYRFGNGEKKLVYVGAIHGGYEWNSALLSYALIDYLKGISDRIPKDLSVIVIPVANPDGLASVVGTSGRFNITNAPKFDYADELSVDDPVVAGRFNANGVDLNRNFNCKWQAEAVWRDNPVSAGSSAFSEPEAAVLRDFLLGEKPEAVVFYHSASNGVYTSFCDGDALPGTVELLTTYSAASGYPRYDDYPYYEVTGDAADWLSTQGISAVSVELETHDVAEWEKNLAGVEAMFSLYSELD
jgi:hypothetical protein